MLRLLFALALLAGASLSAPPAEAAFSLEARAAAAQGTAMVLAGQVCFSQGGRRYCYAIPAGESCGSIRTRYDAHNASNPPNNRYRRFSCSDANVTNINGQIDVSDLELSEDGFDHEGNDLAPRGRHLGVFLSYVTDGQLRVVEANENSNFGLLMQLADSSAGCDAAELPYSVDVLTTRAPGTVEINGRTLDVERVRITAARNARYGDIIIDGAALDMD